ncbi:MAG: CCA tRNA nucleotidyltransferase [Candidatus Spechtbacterales bacterium]
MDAATGLPRFLCNRGDNRHAYQGMPAHLFTVRSGSWKKVTGKGERVVRVPEPAIDIAKEIRSRGGRALLVGGGVRDALMGVQSKDTDIEVYGMESEQIEEVIKGMNPEYIDTVGRSFGVLKTKLGEYEFDISIPRTESKQGEGHKGFEIKGDPNMSPKEAALRRDFTFNAIAQDPVTGEILDFFGGHKDLAKGIIRATDSERFRDDPLRVLRAAQFAGRFGFEIEENTAELCHRMTQKEEFKNLPSARIGEEWKKLLLKSPCPSMGLEAGMQVGAWQALHPELAALSGVPQDEEWHPEGDVWVHTKMTADVAAKIVEREKLEGDDALAVILAALCHDIGKPSTTKFIDGRWKAREHADRGPEVFKRFVSRMEFGKNIEQRVAPLIKDHMFLASTKSSGTSDAAVRRLAKRLEPATIQELIWVMEADVEGRGTDSNWRKEAGDELLKKARELDVSESKAEPILTGKHLINELGLKPGPEFGNVLNFVYEAQLEGKVTNTEEALNMVKDMG